MAAAFDTLRASKELQAAGFEQTQAEAVAKIVRAGQGDLATKDDIAALRTELGALHAELGALHAELGAQRTELGAQRTELGALHAELGAQRAELGAIKWVLGLVAALNIAILVRLLLA